MKKLNEQKFCSWCGSEVAYKSEWMSECPACGYKRYFNPNPCCNLMVTRSNGVLMVQRAIQPKLGKFDFPGGYMDMTDSSMEEAVYREAREEIGLPRDAITELIYHGSGTEPYEWCNSVLNNACFFYVCELKNEAVKINAVSENSAIRWVTKEDLPEIDFAWDIDKRMLAKYFEENVRD